jgi:hypothetical protein
MRVPEHSLATIAHRNRREDGRIALGKGTLTGVNVRGPNGLRWCAAICFRLPPLERSSQVSDPVRTADTRPMRLLDGGPSSAIDGI